MEIQKVEALVRLCAALLLLLTASLVGFGTQSKIIFYVDRKITYNQLHAFQALVYTASAAGAYNLLQLGRCVFWIWLKYKKSNPVSYRYLAWVSYFFDQTVAYTTVAASSAAVEHAVLAVTGMNKFQWTKWCNKFTRFCFQNGVALFCGYAASALLVSITAISAFHLFRLYSPNTFMRLK